MNPVELTSAVVGGFPGHVVTFPAPTEHFTHRCCSLLIRPVYSNENWTTVGHQHWQRAERRSAPPRHNKNHCTTALTALVLDPQQREYKVVTGETHEGGATAEGVTWNSTLEFHPGIPGMTERFSLFLLLSTDFSSFSNFNNTSVFFFCRIKASQTCILSTDQQGHRF